MRNATDTDATARAAASRHRFLDLWEATLSGWYQAGPAPHARPASSAEGEHDPPVDAAAAQDGER